MSGIPVNVGVGGSWGSGSGSSDLTYFGAPGQGFNPLMALMMGGLNDYMNSGALTDLIKGGAGFGQSRRYRQYNPYDPEHGFVSRNPNAGGNQGGGPGPKPQDPGTGAPTGPKGNNMAQSLAPGAEERVTNAQGREVDPRAMGPGQQPADWYDPDDPYGRGHFDEPGVGQGPISNQYWAQHDDAPVEGQGLIGEILGYGQGPNDIDQRLAKDLGWQAGGDLMDLENRELGAWEKFGQRNNTEKNIEDQLGWWQKGELTDLEQEDKWNWKNLANPGQHDALRGDTLTGMVGSKGYSPTERNAMMGASLLPIQQSLEAQKLEGDARQAATGNAAGRWGASNAMALNAAGQASQAGRDIEMGSAQQARQDRAQGLEGLGGLQSQVDQRKMASAQGASNLASRQRESQKFGMNTGLALNDQMRGAQAMSAQGIGGLGQRQRANTQWGLEALSGQNQNMKNDRLTGIGLRNDFMNQERDAGMAAANMAAGIGSLNTGTSDKFKQSGGSANFSV